MQMMKVQSSIVFLVMMTLAHSVAPLETNLQGQKNLDNKATPFLHRMLARELEDYTGLCADEVNTADSCGATEDCADCSLRVLNSLPSYYDTCEDFRNTVCSDLEQCQSTCGTCFEKVADVIDCAFSNSPGVDQCNLNCSSVSGKVTLLTIMALIASPVLLLLF
jgi:hypothetical protein